MRHAVIVLGILALALSAVRMGRRHRTINRQAAWWTSAAAGCTSIARAAAARRWSSRAAAVRLRSTGRSCSRRWPGPRVSARTIARGWGGAIAGQRMRRSSRSVSDLHGLLQAAGENGPFVLVGASIGGIYIRAYQRTYPGEVAALVFTNSAGRVGLITKSGGDLLWKLSEDDIRSAYPLPATARLPRPVRTGQPFDRLPARSSADSPLARHPSLGEPRSDDDVACLNALVAPRVSARVRGDRWRIASHLARCPWS